MKRLRRRFLSETGAEFVEFALAFPLLLLVILGIVDFGMMFQQYEVITNAAREGARVGVLPGYCSTDIQNRVQQYIDGSFLSGGGTPSVATPVYNAGARTVTVTVTYSHEYLFVGGIMSYFGGSLGSKTLTASSTMRTEAAVSGSCVS